MKHRIKGKVRLYYVCNNIAYIKKTYILKKTNKMITAFRNICTKEPAAGLENKKTNKQKKRFVLICPSIAFYLGRNFQ